MRDTPQGICEGVSREAELKRGTHPNVGDVISWTEDLD